MSKIRILLADDNAAVLTLVAKVLEKDYDVVAAIKDGGLVVEDCLRLKPDVAVLDISMGEINGIELARELRDSGCRSKVVFLTIHEDYDFVNAAIGAGALAYVVKSRLSTDLISAVKAVLADKFFVSATLSYDRPELGH